MASTEAIAAQAIISKQPMSNTSEWLAYAQVQATLAVAHELDIANQIAIHQLRVTTGIEFNES